MTAHIRSWGEDGRRARPRWKPPLGLTRGTPRLEPWEAPPNLPPVDSAAITRPHRANSAALTLDAVVAIVVAAYAAAVGAKKYAAEISREQNGRHFGRLRRAAVWLRDGSVDADRFVRWMVGRFRKRYGRPPSPPEMLAPTALVSWHRQYITENRPEPPSYKATPERRAQHGARLAQHRREHA